MAAIEHWILKAIPVHDLVPEFRLWEELYPLVDEPLMRGTLHDSALLWSLKYDLRR